MNSSVAVYLKIIWSLLMLAVAIWWSLEVLRIPQADEWRHETHLLAAAALVVLTFPLGVIWASIVSIVGYVIARVGYSVPDAFMGAFLWLGFFLFGWFQWFVLLPKGWNSLIKTLKGRSDQNDSR